MPRHLGRRIVVVFLLMGAAVALVVLRPVRLGLDLSGGTQVVLEARDSPTRRADSDAVDRALEVLRRRVDQLGVSEPTLQRSGDRRIIVELPGVVDPEEAVRVIGQTAQLTFHPVLDTFQGAGLAPSAATDSEGELILPDEDGTSLRLGRVRVTGEAVRDAQAVLDSQQLTSQWVVNVTFAGEGARDWEELTAKAACQPFGDPGRRIAIVLDQEVISSPEVSPEVQCDVGITGGTTSITGDFSDGEAKDLALLIRAGALPVPVEIVEQRTIGPTLGEAAIRASVVAALVGAALTILYMVAYYRLLGAVAALALLLYGLFSFAALTGIGATLTLPGIAGFVLAIGMAVDANVLVFERIKEEHAAGRHLASATANGFKRAWSAIADSNATTLLAAILLFFLASGPVKGFGITLTLGVTVSMFTALVVTRMLVELVLRSGYLRARPGLLGMYVGAGFRRWILDRGLDIVGRRWTWFAVSSIALVLALAGLVTNGLRFGLEFQGGRLVEYATTRPVDLEAVRSELADRGFPRALVQQSGDGNVSVRTGPLSGTEEVRVEEAVAIIGGPVEKLRDEFIGATVSGELIRRAVVALALALGAQLLYLAFRFRWIYGASAVVAMLHDVLILLGVFAWLGKTIDGVFLASLLTVIGYSVNDSVVVFDRIREQRGLRAQEPLAVVANDACLQTLPRTINTGLGASFILAVLFLFGGETLTDFALALLIGILVGTYSSIFTAAPLAVGLERLSTEPSPPARGSSREGSPPLIQPARVGASVAAEMRAPLSKAGASRKRAGPGKRKRRR
jgi:SecD/SecF fusion protein